MKKNETRGRTRVDDGQTNSTESTDRRIQFFLTQSTDRRIQFFLTKSADRRILFFLTESTDRRILFVLTESTNRRILLYLTQSTDRRILFFLNESTDRRILFFLTESTDRRILFFLTEPVWLSSGVPSQRQRTTRYRGSRHKSINIFCIVFLHVPPSSMTTSRPPIQHYNSQGRQKKVFTERQQ
jgi:hypothetical protein